MIPIPLALMTSQASARYVLVILQVVFLWSEDIEVQHLAQVTAIRIRAANAAKNAWWTGKQKCNNKIARETTASIRPQWNDAFSGDAERARGVGGNCGGNDVDDDAFGVCNVQKEWGHGSCDMCISID